MKQSSRYLQLRCAPTGKGLLTSSSVRSRHPQRYSGPSPQRVRSPPPSSQDVTPDARSGNSTAAAPLPLEEPPDGDYGRDGSPFVRLNMEGRRRSSSTLRPDGEAKANATYGWLLDGCCRNGSLVDAQRVHGRTLKLGLVQGNALCEKLLDVYSAFGDLGDALTMFDEMPLRGGHSWNRVIAAFLWRKQLGGALVYFSRMLRETEPPLDAQVFATMVRACTGSVAHFRYAQQLHAKTMRCGFHVDSVVGNPLIDLYSKGGFVNAAWLVFEELAARDRIAWVAMTSGFSHNGYEEDALVLYSEMRRSGVVPTSYVFSSVLSACTKARFLNVGEQMHGQAFKWGMYSETFVCNALISMYSRQGDMCSAQQVLRKMPCADAVSFNSLISANAQGGNAENALQMFEDMQDMGLKPDCVTTATLLSACASSGATTQGQQLHAYAIKAGMTLDIIIEGSLLDFYVNCADMDTAYQLFSLTRKENVVLWNVMLMGYGRLGMLRESSDLFCQMQEHNVSPNQYTYPSILGSCALLGALDLGEQIHSLTIKSGLELYVYLSSVLIDMYCKCGRLEQAREILERSTEKDVVSWTAMMAGYTQNDLYTEALTTFKEMLLCGIRLDNIGLSSAISACAGLQASKSGLQIHAQAVMLGHSGDISIGNALVCLYARCGQVGDAYSAFGMIKVADEGSWNGLISGFAQSGHNEEALKVFRDMNRAGSEANLFTYGSAICASAHMADAKQGKQIHALMVKTAFDCCEIEAGNALITLYSKCGSIEDAMVQFSTMAETNDVSWNAMITGYSQHGRGNEALGLFEKMKQKGFKPNHVTFVGVLSACSHVGLVTKGLNYFKAMREVHGILQRPEHYACMVDILGRAGQLDRAREFIDEMPIPPDSMVWKTLLGACRVHKNVEMGEFAACHLLELDPQDSATYVLLSNIYAVAKRWKCRDLVRQQMKGRGVKKEPGCSWIEVKNSIHAFFAGDRSHPMADEIYICLDDLIERAAKLGYVQDKDSLLHDMEQEQKDPAVYVHSEKIAVAFGIISFSKVMPIRVIKNLRICNDCHTWMKYVSKITERTLVVRDSFRYHHFEGGTCSCQDYW